MAYIPSSGSVVAFQSDATKLVATVSVSGVIQPSSVTALQGTNPWIITGSVQAAVNTGNSSVQLLAGNAMIGSVTTYQGATPWVITGSIQGGGGGIQYVEDTQQTSTTGTVILFRKNDSTSIMGVISPGNPLPVGGSIATLQGTNPWRTITSISGGVTSVGQVGQWNMAPASIQLMAGINNAGSITAIQGTNPWVVGNSSVQVVGAIPTTSVVVVPGIGVLGSVATLQGTNPWVIGNSSVMLTPGINAIGSVAALQGTNPWLVQTVGSVLNQYREDVLGSSVVGVAMMFKRTDSASLMSAVSPNYPLPVQGSITTLQGTNPWVVGNSSVQVVGVMPTQSVMVVPGIGVLGSVATLQGTNPWVIGNTSVLLLPGLNTIGSVAVLQGTNPWITTTQASSIVGTYAEDTGHTDGDKGLFTLGVRNDNAASFASANTDYSPFGVDSAGRMLTKPFAANEAYVTGVASTVNTGPSSLISGAGAGLRNYVTDLWIANTGSVATLVSFRDGDASIIGKTIAPAGGGSNIRTSFPMRTGNLNSPIEFTAGTATSILHVTAFGYKAP